MTLTLEDVKNVRFPIAKRQGEGYRATEVDDFVDAVDATFTQLSEENERLKAQLSAIDMGGTSAPAAAPVADPAVLEENERLKAELAELRNRPAPAAAVATPSKDGEVNRLRAENESLQGQLEGVRGELEGARKELATARQGALGVVEQGEQGRVEKIVVTTAAQASPALVRMVQLHTEQAEMVVAEAEAEGKRKLAEAERRANELALDAQTRAEKIQSEARVNADQMTTDARNQAAQVTSEAKANADRVNSDADNRRRELFTSLEAERDQLLGKIDQLKGFETSYRSNLLGHLRSSIEHIEKAEVAPREVPALLGEERPAQSTSNTPRLDALLAEGQQQA